MSDKATLKKLFFDPVIHREFESFKGRKYLYTYQNYGSSKGYNLCFLLKLPNVNLVYTQTNE